ncbi:Pvc16 family protein [Paracoccus sp. NGMCC 1.201697]|uniref:Pvc16 family protein n=1 Tax=Paracoccus broussonetiae subsp. drimophilus TaxID=3373869 RepID=A0ABW7LMR2_9RHOB
MARFVNLHDAGRALASHLKARIAPLLSDIVAGPPIENPATQGEAIRVSLLWVTPQPTHRNDPWFTDDAGQRRPPPLSLSAYFVVTSYGNSPAGEPVQAVNRLGQALQVIETAPTIEMPITAAPNIDPVPGSGRMNATLVPVAADLMEKIFTPLQMRHRPWALVELGPVQLERLDAPLPAAVPVVPGGVRLAGPAPVARPAITTLHPSPLGRGRRIRIDSAQAANATELQIGDQVFVFADPPLGVGEIARPDALGRIFATYPAAAPDGPLDVVLTGPGGTSERHPVTVSATGAALDAPVDALAAGADLVLTGGGLAATDRAFLWPARGIRSPLEVIDLAPTTVAAGQVTLARAGLDAAGLRAIPYLVALRGGPASFTPAVLVEVAP